MHVLVDFDNLPSELQTDRVCRLAEKLVDAVCDHLEHHDSAINIRLYGGWYNEKTLTHKAHRVISAMGSDFPYPRGVVTSSSTRTITVRAELAYSLLAYPRKVLTHTFRTREAPKRFECCDPKQKGCTADECSLSAMPALFRTGMCPRAGCAVSRQALFSPSQEQKLVDSMIVCDMLAHSRSGAGPVAVVSTDDDMWPGILTAMCFGTPVLHVWAKQSTRLPPYAPSPSHQYTRLSI